MTELQCLECGACAEAACDCGVAYVTACTRAAAAIATTPEKSDRAIAAEIGVDHKTVGRARRAGGDHSPPDEKERRIGQDGKSYPATAPPPRGKTRPSEETSRRRDVNEPLETNDNPEPDENSDIAPPEQIEENVLFSIQRINENVRVFTKVLKLSALDREAAERINAAVERTIQKLRSMQSTLEKMGSPASKDPTRGSTPNGGFLLRADEAQRLATFKGKVNERSLDAARATASAWGRLVEEMGRDRIHIAA